MNQSFKNREKALDWWNKLTDKYKLFETVYWCQNKGFDEIRKPESLTGREIEEMYNSNKND